MKRATRLSLALAVLLAGAAYAEEWPPDGQNRLSVYWALGTCNVSKTYNGHFTVDCDSQPHYFGTRTGKWRHTMDWSCDTSELVNDYFEVCTSGNSCSGSSGTWVTITEQQFSDHYCP